MRHGTPLYDWAEVATWMAINKKIPVELAIEAGIFDEANIAIASGQFQLGDRLKKRSQTDELALAKAA